MKSNYLPNGLFELTVTQFIHQGGAGFGRSKSRPSMDDILQCVVPLAERVGFSRDIFNYASRFRPSQSISTG